MKNAHIVGFFAAFVLAVALIGGCNRESLLEEQPEPEYFSSRLITYTSNVIPGQYIVVMKEDHLSAGLRTAATYAQRQQLMKEEGQRFLKKHGIAASKIQYVYGTALKGLALKNLSEQEIQTLLADPAVKYMEQDQVVSLQGGPPKPTGSCASNDSEIVPCGIDLVNGGAVYGGSNKAYVLDTGIDLDHPDLYVASYGFNANTKLKDAATLDDANGHGTHVSGTIAAIAGNGKGVVGVAAGALVVPVKVLDSRGSGAITGIIAGVDYVGGNGQAGDVANMSLGGGISPTLDEAVITASLNGIWFVVAAGNSAADANNYSPARANGDFVRTIAAMDCNLVWASYSNYGMPPVDYIAPGSGICSTYKEGGYASLSGTSMATPHASGVILATNGAPDICGTVNRNSTDTGYPRICVQ